MIQSRYICQLNHRPRACPRRGGFTLIELLVASVITSVALLAVYQILSRASDAERTTRVRWGDHEAASTVVNAIAGTIERGMSWEHVVAVSAGPSDDGGYMLTGTAGPSGPGGPDAPGMTVRYRYRWVPGAAAAAPSPGRVVCQEMEYAGRRNISPWVVGADAGAEEAALWQLAPEVEVGRGVDAMSVHFRPAGEPEAKWVQRWTGSGDRMVCRVTVRVGTQVVERYVIAVAGSPLPGGGS